MTAQYATPGPWEIKKDDDQWRIRQKGTVNRGPGYTLERPVGEGFNYKLDAQLAAAAPDLLKALQAARDLWGDYPPPGNSNAMKAIKMVDAAIAKALGK